MHIAYQFCIGLKIAPGFQDLLPDLRIYDKKTCLEMPFRRIFPQIRRIPILAGRPVNLGAVPLFPQLARNASLQEVEYKLSRSFIIKWWVAFLVSACVVVLATLPPFLPAEWRTLLMLSFSKICHQIPERSPHINEIALGVCHRCYGIYLGLPLATLAYLVMRSLPVTTTGLRLALLGSLGLLALDWVAPLIGLWHNTPVSRMGTGLFFGVVAGFYLARALAGNQDENLTSAETRLEAGSESESAGPKLNANS